MTFSCPEFFWFVGRGTLPTRHGPYPHDHLYGPSRVERHPKIIDRLNLPPSYEFFKAIATFKYDFGWAIGEFLGVQILPMHQNR